MAEQPGTGFAELLRQLRTEAGLTQEELAATAALSPRSVSDLERGIHRTARRDTAGLLADALGLAEPVRALFVAAALGRGASADVLAGRQGRAPRASDGAAPRTLPRDIASFTGRRAELARLMGTLAGLAAKGGVVGIHAIGGMAGVGKTTFAVHAAHLLAENFPDGQLFVPLHAHTAGLRPVDPAEALASLLQIAGVGAPRIPPGLAARTALWRDWLAGKRLLLVLDDAASSEQVLPLLPGTGPSLVLVTSRRHLSALDDATAISLDILPPDEAAGLLVRLADRPGLGLADPEVRDISRLCGYLPLAIGMVARQLHHHPAWSVAGRAAELAAAQDRLELMATENLSVAAAFNLSYQDLTPSQRRLFRRLGLHPGLDIDAFAAAALDGTGLDDARRGLEALYDQHLLTEPANGRYRMHDLIREHARTLTGRLDSGSDRNQAVDRLLDYYQRAAGRADALLARQAGAARLPGPALAAVPALADRDQALAWARAERASLLACLDHATRTGQQARIVALTVGVTVLLRHDGPWAEAITRQATALRAAQHLADRPGQANALANLGDARRLTGDLPGATLDLQQALGAYRDLGHRPGQANALTNLGEVRMLTGEYPAAVEDLESALGIYCDLGHRLGQADALTSLGMVRMLTGEHPGATRDQEEALAIYRDLGHRLGQAYALTRLGIVRRLTGDLPGATRDLEEALGLLRGLGHRLGEANALRSLGSVRRLTGDYPAAARDLEEAIGIYQQIGEPGGEAEAVNEAGLLHWARGDLRQARSCHQKALLLARSIGGSLDEAHALAGLGRCALTAGHAAEAEDRLRGALEIFQRIGAAEAATEVTRQLHTVTKAAPTG